MDKNVDTVAYAYNRLGQARFSQNKEQKLKNALSFVQYDDLGRVTVSGEARIDTVATDYRQRPQWLTEILEPDMLNYNGYNPQTDFPTVNPTMWYTSSYTQQPRFWDYNLLDTAHRMPRLTDTLDKTDPGPYLMHPANYYDYSATVAAEPGNFENIASCGSFVRVANHYDEMPPNVGAIWDRFPERAKWDSLVPYRPWDRGERQPRNLRGRKAAAAYRDGGGEPFHYIVMSYDPRGRVEAMLRYTENLGFDAVYYTYNSANSVISTRVVDPQRQYVTWYGYDDNGRVDKVWTKMTEPGTGFGLYILKIPDSPERTGEPDIVYSYDPRGNVDTVKFLPAFVTQSFSYNPRGWVDSMMAKDGYDEILFRQKFERDVLGNITKQVSKHKDRDELTQTYDYDRLYRLEEWSDGRDSAAWDYDRMGNRLAETKNLTDITSYGYGFANNTNRLSVITHNADTKHYTYNNLGAVTSIASMNGYDTTLAEQFGYAGDGRIKRYTKKLFSASPETYDWRYRYSALGGREQKRLYYNTKGDSINGNNYNYYGWTYYMLGAGGEQLAVYKGVQAAHEDSSGHMGRRVYMYNESYISLGGTLVTLPDNTKQFNAMDNIGSVRLTVSAKEDSIRIQSFDYKPFGDTLNAEDESRIGYASQERDEESRYFAMGARQYDPLAGRFLSVDPLYESFPDKTPYHYCNNNPISFKDPSGLSPEGEKGKEDEVQVVRYNFCDALMIGLSIDQMMIDCYNERKMRNDHSFYMLISIMNNSANDDESGGGGGGGRAGSGILSRERIDENTNGIVSMINGVMVCIRYDNKKVGDTYKKKYGVDADDKTMDEYVFEQLQNSFDKLDFDNDGRNGMGVFEALTIDFTMFSNELAAFWNSFECHNNDDWTNLAGLSMWKWNPEYTDSEDRYGCTRGSGDNYGTVRLAIELLFNQKIKNYTITYAGGGLFNSDLHYENVPLYYVLGHELMHGFSAYYTWRGVYCCDKEGSANDYARMQWGIYHPGYRFISIN